MISAAADEVGRGGADVDLEWPEFAPHGGWDLHEFPRLLDWWVDGCIGVDGGHPEEPSAG